MQLPGIGRKRILLRLGNGWIGQCAVESFSFEALDLFVLAYRHFLQEL